MTIPYDDQNRFMSNDYISAADKKAMATAIMAIGMIVGRNGPKPQLDEYFETWLTGSRTVAGSMNESTYIDFVNAVLNAKKQGLLDSNNPYLNINFQLIGIDDVVPKLANFYLDKGTPGMLDFGEIIDELSVKKDGKIVGIKQSILDKKPNESLKQSLNAAYSRFFEKIDSYSNEIKRPDLSK